jgi:formylglycine-generating enzyme required for sulfatase activity
VGWLGEANPEVAAAAWRRVGAPRLSDEVSKVLSQRWLPRMTDVEREPDPNARAAIGRGLGCFGLDRRRGVGLRADGLPDIDWVRIDGAKPFIYQNGERLRLATFHIARYPVTHAQFQAFIDAGGYRNDLWWAELANRPSAPYPSEWDEPNSPRVDVSWYEAVAFTRWLSASLGFSVSLPTEQQWERTARGTKGREYPWGQHYIIGVANGNETPVGEAGSYVGRTTTVGLYTAGATPAPELVSDLSGNVWEWCLNEIGDPERTQAAGSVSRVLRGGSWSNGPRLSRSAGRFDSRPGYRDYDIGFRVCCGSPIE